MYIASTTVHGTVDTPAFSTGQISVLLLQYTLEHIANSWCFVVTLKGPAKMGMGVEMEMGMEMEMVMMIAMVMVMAIPCLRDEMWHSWWSIAIEMVMGFIQ